MKKSRGRAVTVSVRSTQTDENGKNRICFQTDGMLDTSHPEYFLEYKEPVENDMTACTVEITFSENHCTVRKSGACRTLMKFSKDAQEEKYETKYDTLLGSFTLTLTNTRFRTEEKNGCVTLFLEYTACLKGLDEQQIKMGMDVKEVSESE